MMKPRNGDDEKGLIDYKRVLNRPPFKKITMMLSDDF